MRVFVVLLALCSIANAKPASDGSAVVVVIDRELGAHRLAALAKVVAHGAGALADGDQLGVVAYATKAQVVVPLQTDRAKIEKLLAGVTASRGTNVVGGIHAAFLMLKRSTAQRRRVIVVTNGSAMLGVAPLAEQMRAERISISAVGVDGGNRTVLETIARAGKGRHYRVDAAAELERIIVAEAQLTAPPPETYAFVFVIDRSGSMQGPKLEIAKEVTRAGLEMTAPRDTVAVVAFDADAHTIVTPQPSANRSRHEAAIARLQAAGSTNAFVGLSLAFTALKAIDAKHEHVILVSDGQGPTDGVLELVHDMRAAKITVSAIATPGADRNVMFLVAEAGAGKLFVADEPGFAKQLMRIIPLHRATE